jgi:beta-lactamase superfamily II metal-dependent hydrolase
MNPTTGEPAAITYLAALGLDPAECVRLVLITHFDDDHIRGITDVIRRAPQARIACSLALTRDSFPQFVIEQEQAAVGAGSGLDELREVLRLAPDRGGVIWAMANRPLYPLPPPESGALVTALSPSDDAVERGMIEVIEAATGLTRAVIGRFSAPEGPNGASVVASVAIQDVQLLLGADLENSANPKAGWNAVVASAKPAHRASIVKVPHHGSSGAHHDQMWAQMVEPTPIAVLAPFRNGAVQLPTEDDIERLRALGVRLFVTALPDLVRTELDHSVERLVRREHGARVKALRGWGHVRARRVVGGGGWSVDLEGDALDLAA